MKPIKGVVTTKRELTKVAFRKIVVNEKTLEQEIVEELVDRPTDVTTKIYYTEQDKGYEDIVYDPTKGHRLFDNEQQAEKAGFTRAK